jgi:membrane-associated protein
VLPFDLTDFVRTVGYAGIFVIVFAESGLLLGFFLPGDSLLFTAGFLASQGRLEIWIVAPLCFVAAVFGDALGYWIGRRLGRRLFEREDSGFFKRHHLEQAEHFFEVHGGKAIILARFLAVIRTFTPVVAGAAGMQYRRFATYNAVGAFLWAVGVSVAGYELGSRIPGIDRYLLPIVAVVIAVSALPGAIHLLRQRITSEVS